ncbi:MAG: MFS transporter [Armatimonadetes bacterium]|nr:MFS transporter [Armatimonadota bacterium]
MSKREQGAVPLWTLSAIQLLVLLPAYCLPAILPLVEKEWAITHGAAGLMVAAFQAGYIAAALVALPLTDRLDARYIVTGGAVLSAVTHLFFPLLAGGALSGTLLRALAGMGLGGIYMPGMKIIVQAPRERGRAVGFYVSSYLTGTALSFALTGALTVFLTWKQAYLLLAGACFCAVALAVHLWRQPAAVFLPTPAGAGGPAANKPARAAQVARTAVSPAVKEKSRRLALVLLIFAYAGHTWETYGLRSWLAPFLTVVLQDRLASVTSFAAALTAVSVLLGAPSSLAGGWLSDRLGRTGTALVIMLTSAACSFTIGWLIQAPLGLLLPIGLLYSLTVLAESPILSTGLAEIAPPEKLGRLMAWQTLVGYLAATAAPPFFGLLLDLFPGPEGWALAFSSLGAGALAGAILLFCLTKIKAGQKHLPGLPAAESPKLGKA